MDQSTLASLTAEQKRELLSRLLKRQAESANRFPMSAGQQGLWHAFRRSPQLTAFNVFLPTRIRDPFNTQALQQSINFIAARHAALRTTFTDEGGQLQQVIHERLDPDFSVTEMLGATDEAVRQRVMLETLVPFDLTKGPLLRISVYKLSDRDWVILALTHHIIVDFWSLVLILGELRHCYPLFASGQTPHLPAPVDNYRQFVQDQSTLMASPQGERLAEFWRQNLEGVSPVIELPLDKPRPTAFTNRADCSPVRLSPGVSQRVVELAGACRATPFSVMHAAMQVFLQRYSWQEEFFIGSPFAGRLHQKYEPTVGFFINMLPVKASIGKSQTFAELVSQTTGRLVDTLEHEAFPIAEIVRRANIGRDPSRSPLFQVSCTFERAQKQEELGRASFLFPDQKVVFQFGGLHQESFYIPHPTCHYDLEFIFEHSTHGLQAMLIYCRDLFTAESMKHMSANFSGLLDALLEQPNVPISHVGWKKTSEALQQVSGSSLVSTSVSSQCVHQLIMSTALRQPDAIAFRMADKGVTYQQLSQTAIDIADKLTAGGLQKQSLVPVACHDGPLALTGMLAIQLAGGVPVPIDLAQPSIDPAEAASDMAAEFVLTDDLLALENRLSNCRIVDMSCVRTQLLIGASHAAVEFSNRSNANSNDLAYMIYTSGSTGKPKGVQVEQGAICNTLQWRNRVLPLDRSDRVLMLLSHQFDAAIGIAWSCLVQGATIVWPSIESKRDPSELLHAIQNQQITVLPAVPSLLRVLATNSELSNCSSLRTVWTGGEAVPAELPEMLRAKTTATIWNLYGPTEAAVEATALEITDHSPSDLMTIGWPIDNAEVVIVDENLQPVPTTVPGEIAIGGAGLARGYFKDDELTKRKFIVDPRDPTRKLYLSGDLGRILADGRVEFFGRNDHQVKLRGYRIELGEVESVLQAHPQIERAAVLVDQPNSPNANMIAFVSAASGDVDTEAVRTYLAQRLAAYKIPAAIVVLAELPMTSSGKVDRKRLPRDIPAQAWLENIVQPRNSLESFLIEAWCAELRLSRLGIHQNFFEVGGSSLQAAMLTTELSKHLQVHVPTALLFDLADIAQLAERLAMLHPQVLAARFGQECISFYERADKSHDASPHALMAGLKPTGSRPPIFMVHPPGGIVVCYRELARYMSAEQPLWAIRSRGLHGQEHLPESIQEMAADYLMAIKQVQPSGPYVVGGWSLGGLVAYEMAKQLIASGESVKQLVFLDTTIPEGAADSVPPEEQVNVGLEYGIELTLDQLGELTPEEQLPLLHDHADKLGILAAQSPPEVIQQVLSDLQHLFHHHVSLSRKYKLTPIDAKLLLLRPTEVPFDLKVTQDRGWRHLFKQVEVRFVPGHHHSMVQTPHVRRMAEVLNQQFF